MVSGKQNTPCWYCYSICVLTHLLCLVYRSVTSGAILSRGGHQWWRGCLSYWPRSPCHRWEGCTVAQYGQWWYPLITCNKYQAHKIADGSHAVFMNYLLLILSDPAVSICALTLCSSSSKLSMWLLCLVTVLRSCLVCIGLDSLLVGKLSELSHLSSWANRVSEALLSHLNDTNPPRVVATAVVQGLTCISPQILKGTEACPVFTHPRLTDTQKLIWNHFEPFQS